MRRKEDASAFIIALGILVILFIMAITFATMMVMESRAARNYNDAALCEDVAYGALEEAINALFRDKYGEDASVVAGNLVLEPYDNSNDQGDENWDFWAYEGDPNLDETLWFRSDGGYLSEDASATDVNLFQIKDAGKSWPTSPDIWQDAMVQVAGQMRTVDSNGTNTITVTEAFDPEPKQGDRYMVFFWYPRDAADDPIVKHLPGGLSAHYAILITDDREAKANVNAHGNRNAAGGAQGQNQGVNTYEVSLEDLLALFTGGSGKGDDIIAERTKLPDDTPDKAGVDATDDDPERDSPTGRPPVNQNGVDDDADGSVDNEANPLADEDDEFNPLDPKDDTPFALPQEIDLIQDDTDFESRLESILSSTTLRQTSSSYSGQPGSAEYLYKCLTTYSAGTIEHPFFDPGDDGVDNDGNLVVDNPEEAFTDPSDPDTLGYDLRRYRFGLNQFDPSKDDQIYDLASILWFKGGLTEDQANQFIVNLKDALDGDSTVTKFLTYYGVELRPFITEVMRQDYDEGPPGNMRARYYIELYNPSPNAILVNGWELELVVPGYPNKTAIIPGPPPVYSISGGGFFVIGGRMEPYVDDGTGQHGVTRPTLMQDYDPTTEPPPDISAITLTCTDDDPLPDDTVIDKADGFVLPFTLGTSQERSDFKVDDWDLQNAGHTFTIGSRSPYTPDGTHPRGFDEIFALFIVPDYLDKNNSGSIFDEISSVDPINYDINLANLSDLSRLLVTGYSTNPADPALSQKFKDLKDNEASIPAETDIYDSQYRLIKFDISYANHRQVLDYLTVLNPMGDGYDDDGDDVADDIGPDDTGFTDPSKDDLGGLEHRIPGMININTASKEVLRALPGVDATLAQAIIDNRPYTEIGDLLAVNGFNQGSNDVDDDGDLVIDEVDEKEADYIAFGKISNIITTRSNVFTVYCLAQVGIWNDLDGDDIVDPGEFTIFAERELMAIVDRSTQPINVRFQRWLTD